MSLRVPCLLCGKLTRVGSRCRDHSTRTVSWAKASLPLPPGWRRIRAQGNRQLP